MSEGLNIQCIKDRRCLICNVPELAQYNDEIFYYRIAPQQFLDIAKRFGYMIPMKMFVEHQEKHLYIHETTTKQSPTRSPQEMTGDMIMSLVSQLRMLEDRGRTDTLEYTKKSEMLVKLLDLRGKFEGAFTQKMELTGDFRTLMIAQLKKAIESGLTEKQIEAGDHGNSTT